MSAWRTLGATGLRVHPLGFGAGSIGERDLSDEDAERLLDLALDLGVCLVDTAPSYGLSEIRIGRVMRRRRRDAVLSTKLGYGVPGAPDWTGPCIEAGVRLACERLQTDVLDIAHLHSCPLEILQRDDVLSALARATEQGAVRAAAYSGEGEALDFAIRSGVFSVVQASCSILDPAARGLTEARARGMGTIAKRPLGNAVWREPSPSAADRATYRARLDALALPDLGMDPGELFLRWAAFHPAVDCALVGLRSAERLRACAASVERGPLPEATLSAIASAHVRAGALSWGGVI